MDDRRDCARAHAPGMAMIASQMSSQVLEIVPIPERGPPSLIGIFYGSLSAPHLLVIAPHARERPAAAPCCWLPSWIWSAGSDSGESTRR